MLWILTIAVELPYCLSTPPLTLHSYSVAQYTVTFSVFKTNKNDNGYVDFFMYLRAIFTFQISVDFYYVRYLWVGEGGLEKGGGLERGGLERGGTVSMLTVPFAGGGPPGKAKLPGALWG
jgi:hypothetical protein